MKVHICVRRTLDWGSETFTPDDLWPDLQAKYRTWNETFDMPYPAFRQRLKEIAQRNHAQVDGAVVTAFDDVPPGDLVVPTDDDDWFAPRLAHEIREALRPEAEGCLWRRQVISATRRRPKRRGWLRMRMKQRMGGRRSCATNNYAIVNGPGVEPLVSYHLEAAAYFDAHPRRMAKIHKTLAIQNRTMASRTALKKRQQTTTREELIASYHSYRTLYENWPLPPELLWAKPCVDSMAELMHGIRIR